MFSLLICAAATWVNLTTEPWDSYDKKIFKRAKYVCSTEKYSGCVKTFTKVKRDQYRVICGGK